MELVQQRTCSLLLTSLFKIVLNYFFASAHYFLRTLRLITFSKWKGNLSTSSIKVLDDKLPILDMQSHEEICMEELTMVMDRLGMGFENEGENGKNLLCVNEFEALFDEEISLVEIKEAFEVFDENKDGYIDAIELKRILCGLCIIKEEYGLEECKRMLCAFDDNGDGLIDFQEFVTFMEKLQ